MLIAGLNFATHFKALSGRSWQPYRARPGSTLVPHRHGRQRAGHRPLSARFLNAVYPAPGSIALRGLHPGFRWRPPPALPIRITACGPICSLVGCSFWRISPPVPVQPAPESNDPGDHPSTSNFTANYAPFTPTSNYPVKIGRQIVPDNILFAASAFTFIYASCMAVMTLLMIPFRWVPVTAFLCRRGQHQQYLPGLGHAYQFTIYALSDFQTWICTFPCCLAAWKSLPCWWC